MSDLTSDSRIPTFWRGGFPLLVGLCTLAGVLVTSEALGASASARAWTLNLLGFALLIAFFIHLFKNPPKIEDILLGAAALMLPAMMIFSSGKWSTFWSTIFYLMLVVLILSTTDEKGKSWWVAIRQSAFAYWVLASALLTLADWPLLRHSRPIFYPDAVASPLLDARIAGGILVFTLYSGVALSAMSRLPRPKIPSIPVPRIAPLPVVENSILNSVIRPISILTVLLIVITREIADFAWRIVAEVFTHLNRLGKHMAHLLLEEVIRYVRLGEIVRFSITVLSLLLLLRSIASANLVFIRYVRHEWSSDVTAIEAMMGAGVVLLVLVLLAVASFHVVFSKSFDSGSIRTSLAKAAFFTTMLLLNFAASGILLLLLAKRSSFGIVGFSKMGILTHSMVWIIALMIIYHAAAELVRRSRLTSAHSRTRGSVRTPAPPAGTPPATAARSGAPRR